MSKPPDITLHPGITAMVRGELIVLQDCEDSVILKFSEARTLYEWLAKALDCDMSR